MRIGLYPGTFNPIHNGHLQTALETLENLALDQIIFIPTGSPPHKCESTLIKPETRFEIVE
ncbi:MAG: adenylyltransferase/cytidyltransferase family protein, partial [Nitrospinae bacterium]|nr:adenylyltransferase/cytidyltransferase family protein [Nitrospinota bacterium]